MWLDSAEQVAALLNAVAELDREARADRQVPRRAILAMLTFAGLRLGELIGLRWRDVAAGKITVRSAKTDARARTIDLLPALRDELATLKASAKPHSRARRPNAGGRSAQPEQRPQPDAHAVRRARQRTPRRRRIGAAAGRVDAAQAAPHVRLAARRARDRPRRGDGPPRAHGRGPHASRLPPRDAPRREVEAGARAARRHHEKAAAANRRAQQ